MGAEIQPLSGVKVLDLAWVVAGPLIGRSLADYGASVVRIDSAKRVETAGQAEMLRRLGCQQAQGFFFGAPMSPRELVASGRG